MRGTRHHRGMEEQGGRTAELIPKSLPTQQVRALQRVRTQMVRGAARVEWALDSVVWGLRRRYGKLGPLKVVAYRGYGAGANVILRGRVLESKSDRVPRAEDRVLRNLAFMLRRFNSREVPQAEIRAEFDGNVSIGRTDDEGYFEFLLSIPARNGGEGHWHTAEFQIVGCPVAGWTPAHGQADVLVPGADAEFGIVSDIDDTVLQTHVTRRLKMLWVTLSGSAFTRSTFEGTSELYQALVRGASGSAQNPVFYVSKSPWNLYDFLVDFMERSALPRGPLLLRDIGLNDRPPVDFKVETISLLFAQYPHLSFVLIGDSGERDPDIYLEVAAKFPGRVRAIYIRKVNDNVFTNNVLARAAERARTLGTTLLAITHTSEALSHARSQRLVKASVATL
jgi:phosphatidate phosphatase APP1